MNTTLDDLAPLMRELLHERQPKTSLEALGANIRQTVPDPNQLSDLKLNHSAEVVTFTWKSRHFLVRESFDVFELKGQRIFITGASQLMQSVLKGQDKNKKIVSIAAEMLREAEALLRQSKPDSALEMLLPLKRTLAHLIGPSLKTPKPHTDGELDRKRPSVPSTGGGTLPWKSSSRAAPGHAPNMSRRRAERYPDRPRGIRIQA